MPSYSFISRWAVAERVAFSDDDILVFAGDAGDFGLSAPFRPGGMVDAPLPEALGKLRRFRPARDGS